MSEYDGSATSLGSVTLLDGAMGTALEERGVDTQTALWSAGAIEAHPGEISRLHKEYALAGASVHTAVTFRTRPSVAGSNAGHLTRRAVCLARAAVEEGHVVAGSMGPIEDCYRPDWSPEQPRPAHRRFARILNEAEVDLILCETFPHLQEGWIAVEEAVTTGAVVWASFTPGYRADLLTPHEVYLGALGAAERGAAAVLVNCVPAIAAEPYVAAVAKAAAEFSLPFGVYANAGALGDGLRGSTPEAMARWVDLACRWRGMGATLIGGCCGTGPAHIQHLRREFFGV